MPRLLLIIADDYYFCSHRLHLAHAARRAGYDVSVATRVQHHGKIIEDEGFRLYPIRLRRGFQSPLQDLAALWELVQICRREQPDIVHHVDLKMVLFGGIASRLVGVPARIHAITGLGHLFHDRSPRTTVLRNLLVPILRWAVGTPYSTLIFQNDEDRQDLLHAGVMRRTPWVLIRGAGVDTSYFRPSPEAKDQPLAVLPARMLRDKGVIEFVEAARRLKADGVRLRCALVGAVDDLNPSGLTEEHLRAWVREGVVEYWGHCEDMARVYAAAHVVVLPSYHEGLPKVLLEGAATGRPLIATRIRGCQEVVRHGDNGLLVPVRNAGALAAAMKTLAEDPALRLRMGARSRELAVREFSQERIADETLATYRRLGAGLPAAAR